MIPVFLTKIKTSDGVILDGIYVRPRRRSQTALIWIHGFSSRFSSGQAVTKELSSACVKNGIGYFKFNNRGHDVVNKDARGPAGAAGGGAFEKFEECIYDIRAVVKLAENLGYKKLILAGHSSGANKALYYLWKTQDRRIKGLALIAPVNDNSAGENWFGKKGLRKGIALAQKILNKDRWGIMSHRYGVFGAGRFLSLFRPGSTEDVFPYTNSAARWKELRGIRMPLAVIFGSRDEYAKRPVKKLLKIFEKNAVRAKSFSGIIVPSARHSFRVKAKEFSRALVNWIKQAVV